MAVLLGFLIIVDLMMVTNQREKIIDDAHKEANRELILIGAFVREALLRHDYVVIEQVLEQWGNQYEDVVTMQATAPNGFVLARYQQPVLSDHIYSVQYKVQVDKKSLITLEMDKDFSFVESRFAEIINQLVLRSLVITALLGIVLWFTLKKMAIQPLEREINRRKQAEQEFRMLLDGAPDAMALVNVDGGILMVNAQMENIFEYSRNELFELDIINLIPERFREKQQKNMQDYFASPSIRQYGSSTEIFGLTKSGREIPVEIGLSPFETDEGVKVLIDIHDITQRKKANEALKRSEERYREFVEGTEDLVTQVDSRGRIIFVNHRSKTVFGLSPKECIGRSAFEFIHPDDKERTKEAFLKWVRDKDQHASFENRQVSRSGEIRDLLWSINFHFNEKGEVTVIDSIAQDITDRKSAEEKIKRNYAFQRTVSSVLKISLEPIPLDEQLEQILDQILKIPFLSFQAKGSIYIVEEKAKELVMKAHRGLDSKLLTECARIPFGRCLCGKAADGDEIVFSDCIDDEHEMYCHSAFPHGHYCVPVRSGKQVHGVINLVLEENHLKRKEEEEFLAAIADTLAGVIEHKKTEQEKDKLQEQLIQSEKLSALGRMTANVAHEIRNPLTALGGLARRLDRTLPEGSREKEYTGVIVSEAGRLERILASILSFTKKAVPNKEMHDINEIINNALLVFDILFKDKSVMVSKTLQDVPQILIHREMVREVIDNLLSNAVEAMSEGGKIFINTLQKNVKEKDYVVVEVADTGEGISVDGLKRIFEPFFTTKAVGPTHGIGLGLSICRKIMDEHKGLIQVESKKGEGTTFSLHFPV